MLDDGSEAALCHNGRGVQLDSHAGRERGEGTFRALTQGYNHWASGRIERLDVNVLSRPIGREAINEARELPPMVVATVYRSICHHLLGNL